MRCPVGMDCWISKNKTLFAKTVANKLVSANYSCLQLVAAFIFHYVVINNYTSDRRSM